MGNGNNRSLSNRLGDPLERPARCRRRAIIVPNNYENLERQIIEWMSSCVQSRTETCRGVPANRELNLVPESNLRHLWDTVLRQNVGVAANLIVEYNYNPETLFTYSLTFQTNLQSSTPNRPPSTNQTTLPENVHQIQELISGEGVFPFRPIPNGVGEDGNYEYLNKLNGYRDTIYAYLRGRYIEDIQNNYLPRYVNIRVYSPNGRFQKTIRNDSLLWGIRRANMVWGSIPVALRNAIVSNQNSLIRFRYPATNPNSRNYAVSKYLIMMIDIKISIAIYQMTRTTGGAIDPNTSDLLLHLAPQNNADLYNPRQFLFSNVFQ